MVICQFFLKGTCKFGDRCFNEHRRPENKGSYNQGYGRNHKNYHQDRQGFGGGGGRYNQGYHGGDRYSGGDHYGGGGHGHDYGGSRGSGNFGRDRYHYDSRNSSSYNRFSALSHQPDPEMPSLGQKPQSRVRTSSTSGQHSLTLDQKLERIKRDVKEWQQSGQWPLSCYAAFTSDPCLEGLADISPEELRDKAYKANSSQNAGSYVQSLQELMQRYNNRKHELVNMSSSMLQQEISRPASALPSGLFGNTTSPASTLSFGGKQTSLFGNTTSPVTTEASTGLFGSSSASVPGSSTLAPPAFPTTTPSKPFGSSGPFGSSSGPFGASSGPASSSQPSSSLFVSSPETINPRISEGTARSPTSPTACSTQTTVVSPLRCSEEDMKAFKNKHFVLGAIPECPPPPELC